MGPQSGRGQRALLDCQTHSKYGNIMCSIGKAIYVKVQPIKTFGTGLLNMVFLGMKEKTSKCFFHLCTQKSSRTNARKDKISCSNQESLSVSFQT